MIKINKKASFWIRFLSTFIDAAIFFVIVSFLSLICIYKKEIIEESIQFQEQIYLIIDYMYFVWLLLLVIILLIEYLFLPLIFKGRTIGMIITRLKVDFNDQKMWKVILKRVELGAFLWIFIIIMFVIFVWPNTINKLIIYNHIYKKYPSTNNEMDENVQKVIEKYKWNILEITFYSIPSVLSPLVILIQLFLLISIGFKGNKTGLIDKFTNSQIIYINKYDLIEKISINKIKPEKNIKYKIVWKE